MRAHPRATLVSPTSDGLVASHCPVVLEETEDASISLLTHSGRLDDVDHEIGRHEMMAVTAHPWGTPQVLSGEEDLAVLRRLVDLFEAPMPVPRSLDLDEALARRAARGTVGLRIPVTRFDARRAQPERAVEQGETIARLDGDSPYASAGLVAGMRRRHGLD